MKNKALRRWYQFLAVILPMHWIRNNKTTKEWDLWLWDAIIDNKIDFVGTHIAIIDDKRVWIENYPYANGTGAVPSDEASCSRATAILLYRRLPEALLVSKLKYGHLEYMQHGNDIVL